MRIIIDLDHTICTPHDDADQSEDPHRKYRDATPDQDVIARLRAYRGKGAEIVIHTSRNMRTFGGDVQQIEKITLPLILDWLDRHAVPHDEVIVGKPWCGFDGFYVDDRAIRPSEFVAMTADEIEAMLQRERG